MNLRAVIYARVSVSTEASVSIARQIEAAEAFAARKGWTVVGTFVDDGVSASKNRPEERTGWRELNSSSDSWDVVIVWKLDRLVRSMRHFSNVHEWLRTSGKSMALVEGDLDMTTTSGEMMATLLAGQAQMEAENISARVAAARTHLLQQGRVVGGTVPYGWRSVPNPDGPGYVLRHDPERIDWVRGMVERTQRGDTLYMTMRWLDDEGAPLSRGSQQNRKRSGWDYKTIERILRHPILAGATPFNPGNDKKVRGEGLLRDESGLPVVDPAVAILSLPAWRALVEKLDNRDSPQSKPRAMRSETSGLLSGLVFCGDPRHEEPVRMWRGTTQGRPSYQCRQCYQTISNFEQALIDHFLEMKGDWVRWSKVEEVHESGAADLPEIEHRLSELDGLIREASAKDRGKLRKEQDTLFDLRDQKRSEPGRVVEVWNPSDKYFSELWAAAGEDTAERRAVLEDALDRVVVKRGSRGRRGAAQALERLDITWKRPEELGPREVHIA